MLICSTCNLEAPDDEAFCPSCLGDLVAGSTSGGTDGPPSGAAAGSDGTVPPPGSTSTQGTEGSRRSVRSLALEFGDGGTRVLVEPGSRTLLGRHPELSKHADRLTDDTVSRRHATIGIDADGTAWIRDEFALNRTSVNGGELDAGAEMPLRSGDLVRLGKLTLKVLFVRDAAAGPNPDGEGQGS